MNAVSAPLRDVQEPVSAAHQAQIRVLCVLFFFSGFPALIYQLVWQRALFRIFGVNMESVTIVVTAFMLGLGLGGLLGGLVSRHRALPLLLLLAGIEALTAVFGFWSLAIFERVGGLVLGATLWATAAVTLLLVAVPTLLMGATLPLLVAYLVRRSGNVGASVGKLYYVNTLGAGAACLIAALGLFPFLGMQGSVIVAVALNAAVAVGAAAAHVVDRRRTVKLGDPVMDTADGPKASPLLSFRLVLALSCASGLISLSYEIYFFRTLSYATGSSAVAFALTLGAFLVGLASGSRVGSEACGGGDGKLVRRMQTSLFLATLVGLAFLPLLNHLAWLKAGVLGVGLLLVYLLARFWGFVLPCLAQLGVRADDKAGLRSGLLYLANIIGAAAGSVLTGFVLMDHLSLVQMGQLLVASTLALALLLGRTAAADRPQGGRHMAMVSAAALAALLLLPLASRGVLESLLWKGRAEANIPFAQVIENRGGIITVDQTGTVFGNGAYDGHFNVNLVNDVNGIVRPYALSLFHPRPRDVLMIGLASGSWAQVIAHNPMVESLTVVEINPGYATLVAGNPTVASVLKNPKVQLVVDDGRRWLRMNTGRRFDAIVVNSTFHHRANATNLLSAEFLAIEKRHLNPGGFVFYNTTESSRVQRTACTAFAHGARFTNHMVASESPIDWDFARWRRVLEAYRIDGRPVLDLSRADQMAGVDKLMTLQSQIHAGGDQPADRWIEPCSQVLERTADQKLVTDDNMGTEWRHFWDTN